MTRACYSVGVVLTDDEYKMGNQLRDELASLRAQEKAKLVEVREFVGAAYDAHPDQHADGLVPALCSALGVSRNHVYRLRDEYRLAHPRRARRKRSTSP